MSAAAKPPYDHPDQDAAYFRAVNLRMIEAGVHLVEELDQPASREATPLKDRVEIYERTTRSIRRGILIAQKLAEHAARPGQRITEARQHIQRYVEDMIYRRERSPSRTETLRLELLERLEDPALEAELLTRPAHDLATEFCRDLGLAEESGLRFYKRRTPADIAELRATAAKSPQAPSSMIILKEN